MSKGFIPTPADFQTVQDFKDEANWPLPYTATVGLAPYIRRMKGDLTVVELGTARGEGAVYLLDECPNIVSLIAVDQYKEYQDWNGLIEQAVLDQFESIAKINFSEYSKRVTVIRESTMDALKNIPDDSVDVLFIDADHSENAVYDDILFYYPKVKKGGIVAVHDTNLQSVVEATKKARESLKSRVPLNRIKNGVAFWYKN